MMNFDVFTTAQELEDALGTTAEEGTCDGCGRTRVRVYAYGGGRYCAQDILPKPKPAEAGPVQVLKGPEF